VTRFVKWLAWASGLCDDKGGPSAPKVGAALVIGAAVFVAIMARDFSSGTSFVITIALAALFGRSVFLHALERGTWGFTRSDSTKLDVDVKVDAAAVVDALKRRDPEKGAEATP
jgi:hypothetical protein